MSVLGILASVISVLIGGGILAFVQFLISRHDTKHDKFKEIMDAMNDIKKEVGEIKLDAARSEAVRSRTSILRFQDELYNDIKHSKEYFEQVLDDIQTYEQYCKKDEDFANGRTKAAAKHIQTEYDRLFNEHKL